MRIAIVYPDIDFKDGYPRDFNRLANEYKKAGHDVVYLGKNNQWSLPESGDEINVAHFIGIFFPRYSLLARNFRAKKIPYIISPLSHLQALAMDVRRLKKTAYINLIGRSFLKSAAAVHSFGASDTESVHSVGYRGRIYELPLGIYIEDLPEEVSPVASLNIKKQVVYFGRLDVHQKGLDYLIDGFEAYFATNHDPITLVIAGRSWKGSDRWISERVKSSPASSHIKYVGEISIDDKYRLLRESLALIYPSRYDGPPRPVREALGIGTYILASRQGNVWTDLERRGAGTVFNCDPVGVKQALCSLSSGDRKDCRDEVRQALAWPKVAGEYLEMYEDVATQYFDHKKRSTNAFIKS